MINRLTFQQALLQMVGYRGIRGVITATLEPHGLNTAQWVILGLIAERPKQLRITDVATRLRVEDPLVTNLVRELVDAGLVKSLPHNFDKRARVLALSAKGERTVDQIEPQLNKALAPIEACVSPADWETYFATLEKIIAATERD